MQRYRVVIMLVLFGVLPVVVAFFVALSFLEEQEIESPPIAEAPVVEAEPPPPPPETRKVFAAARALPVGTLLGKEELGTIEIDVTEIEEGHIKFEKECTAVFDEAAGGTTSRHLCGYAVRTALDEGAPLTWSAVVGPRQKGFLAAVLRPGTRGVMVRVGEATRQAGLIDPGDRVDVILSAELSIDGGERIVFARTIAEDVRVVAIDRKVDDEGRRVDDEGRTAVREEISTATLEASPAQADRLVLGEHEGRLSLAVRSLAAPATVAKNPAQADAVELREMLLSSPDFSVSEARLRRVQELGDLAIRQQLVESKAQLKAMIDAGETKQDEIRVFRGNAPAEVVVFERR